MQQLLRKGLPPTLRHIPSLRPAALDGRKRKEIPTTLEYVNILMRVGGPESAEALKECMDLAMRDCSMVQTVYKVAEIEYTFEKM